MTIINQWWNMALIILLMKMYWSNENIDNDWNYWYSADIENNEVMKKKNDDDNQAEKVISIEVTVMEINNINK